MDLGKLEKSFDNRKQYCIRLFGYDVFVLTIYLKHGWFRLFGRGLRWKNNSEWILESEGYGCILGKIRKWEIYYLPR
mgnify:CR=1 FL=1